MKNDIPVYINYGIGRFLSMLEQYAQFLKTVPLNTFAVRSEKLPTGIVVSARNNSGIPLCNLTLALLYAARGYPVTIIWDDLEFLDPEWDAQNRCVGMLVEAICKHSVINFVQLSTFEGVPLDEAEKAYLQKLAFNNAVWNVRDVVPSEELEAYTRLSLETMIKNASKIKHLYEMHSFDHCVHQSLMNNNGGVHKYFANIQGIRFGCLDAANGRGMIGLQDVQGYFYDVLPLINPRSPFYLFEDSELKDTAIELAFADHEERLYGKDARSTQPEEFQRVDIEQYDIVIPLNIFWDASALGRNRLFASPYEWLRRTVSFILFETPYSVALRQHPHEIKFKKYKFETGTILGNKLMTEFGDHPRFRFITSEEKVNTYHLIQQAHLVLPYTSTLGIEAVMMGKSVLVESNVYYADQPFVYKAESVEDYFGQIKQGKEFTIAEADKTDASLLYFLVTQTPFFYTPFGLDPTDIQKWTSMGFAELNKDEALDTAIHCMVTNTPYAFANGKHILDQAITNKEEINDADIAYHS